MNDLATLFLIFGGMGIVYLLYIAAMCILWLLVPFAIFGIKKRMDSMIVELDGINRSLGGVQQELSSICAELNKHNNASRIVLPDEERHHL